VTILLFAPLTSSVLLALTAAPLGRRLPPAASVRLLSSGALVAALSTGFVLSMAAFVAAAQLQPVATVGRWSAQALAAGEPVPLVLGLLCVLATTVLVGAATQRIVRSARDLYLAAAACRQLGTGTAGLVIV